MNEYLKKIEENENTEERFKYIDFLLKNNSIDIKLLEDYYAENVSWDTILFAERYHNIINIERFEYIYLQCKSNQNNI